MTANIEEIAEQLDSLTLLEAAQLSKRLQEKWGVSAAVAMAAPAAGGAGAGAGAAAAVEEQTEFDVILSAIGDKKIQVIDRKSTRLNSSHGTLSRMPSSA